LRADLPHRATPRAGFRGVIEDIQPMKLREKKERLLVRLYLSAKKGGYDQYYELKAIADEMHLPRDEGELRAIATDLGNSGLVETSFSFGIGPEGGLDCRIVAYGIEEAEELLERHPDYGEVLSASVPASDRYVSLGDNERADLERGLADLRSAVSASNEGSEEDRLVALSEIAAFEATVSQPRVSDALIERFANQVVRWIKFTFSAAVASEIAEKLIEVLLRLIGK
jgi:hypothetical protein